MVPSSGNSKNGLLKMTDLPPGSAGNSKIVAGSSRMIREFKHGPFGAPRLAEWSDRAAQMIVRPDDRAALSVFEECSILPGNDRAAVTRQRREQDRAPGAQKWSLGAPEQTEIVDMRGNMPGNNRAAQMIVRRYDGAVLSVFRSAERSCRTTMVRRYHRVALTQQRRGRESVLVRGALPRNGRTVRMIHFALDLAQNTLLDRCTAASVCNRPPLGTDGAMQTCPLQRHNKDL